MIDVTLFAQVDRAKPAIMQIGIEGGYVFDQKDDVHSPARCPSAPRIKDEWSKTRNNKLCAQSLM
ncbi:MAG: hypothetical protein ABI980_16830 [Nitrospirota bacterium]